jgi:hypothetical protein
MSHYMTHADFEIDPFTYLGSTLGNALYSGLTLEDVFQALTTADSERKQHPRLAAVIHERFDNAVCATIALKKIPN